MKTKLILLAGTALLAFAGCDAAEPEDAPPIDPGQFEDGTGQVPPSYYPTEAKGYEVGSVIPNFKFWGLADVRVDPGIREMALGDFFNPNGDAVYPEGSIYGAGTLVPKAVSLSMSSVWCPPCNAEAADILPGVYDEYEPQGGHLLSVLIDGPEQGVAATFYDLTTWGDRYLTGENTHYSLGMDPAAKIGKLFGAAIPANLIIRTSDMRIIVQVDGVPQASYWATFAAVIDGTFSG